MTDASRIQQINNLARELMKHGQASTMEDAMKQAQNQLTEEPVQNTMNSDDRQPAPPVSLNNSHLNNNESNIDLTVKQTENSNSNSILNSDDMNTDMNNIINENTNENIINMDSTNENVSDINNSINTNDSVINQQNQSSSDIPNCDETTRQKVMNTLNSQQSILSTLTTTVDNNSKNIEQFNSKLNGLIAEFAEIKTKLQKLLDSPVVPPLNKDAVIAGQTQIKPDPNVQLNSQNRPTLPHQGDTQSKQDASGHARSGNYTPDDVSIEKVFYCGPK